MYDRADRTHWRECSVHDLAIWKNGLAFRDIDFAPTGRPVIKISELKAGVTAQTSRTNADLNPEVRVRKGDMLFSWSGNPDTSIDVFRWQGEEGWLNQHIFKVVPKEGLLDDYLFFMLRWLRPRFSEIARNKQTTGLGHVTLGDIRLMRVGVPDLREQKRIVAVLSPIEQKIAINSKIVETLETMAHVLFESWFIDFEPVRAKIEGRPIDLSDDLAALFPDILVDDCPSGWLLSPLREQFRVLSGGTPSKSNAGYWGGGMPWVTPRSMVCSHVTEAAECVTMAAVGNGTRIAPAGSILVMVRGMGLHQGVRISQVRRDVTFNQDVKALVPKELSSSYLLYALLACHNELHGKVRAAGHGTGVLPSEALDSILVPVPPANVQKRLFRPFEVINERIALARLESQTLDHLRASLLPKLISGELRIRDAERFVADAA